MNRFRKILAAIIVAGLGLGVGTVWAGPVDINSADADTLAKELDGIGPSRAQAIVEFREKHGPFKSADELKLVSGIGDKVLDANRGNILINGKASGG
ncbi:MAG: helix-hairpin-helix domain-containing protein [Gammaproteobacteria bacterium]|nr:helix-hairpin-helix domain-containing protein [Gammaproteobacteria bacterium]